MKVLLWLMIPVAALIVGIIWASLRSRPRRPAAMQDSMASFSRFRRALARSHVGADDADDDAHIPVQGDLDQPAGRGTRAE
jgi:hypothetical protein